MTRNPLPSSRPRLVAVTWTVVVLTAGILAYAQTRSVPARSRRPAPATKARPAPSRANADAAPPFAGGPLARQLQMNACYVKEVKDRPWSLRVVGQIPHGPGLLALVFNESGDCLLRQPVPQGDHPAAKPFIINLPADGKAQQYVIKLLGHQDNLNGITLPVTDLPHEVYGDSHYSFGHGPGPGLRRLAAFQVSEAGRELRFNGWGGNYRILDDTGATVADSKEKQLPAGDPAKIGGANQIETLVAGLVPGKTYWLDPYGVMYLGVHDARLYLTFNPQRWFEPKIDWTLESRPWWKGLLDE